MTESEKQLRSIVDRIEKANATIDECNGTKAAAYKEIRALGFDPRTLQPLPKRRAKKAEKKDVSYQPPRTVGIFEQTLAYRNGEPVSQDFTFKNATVYFFAFYDLSRIKIGISNNVDQRKKDIERNCGANAVVLHTCPGNKKDEAAFHKKFSRWQLSGEWFALTEATLRMVSQIKDVQAQEAA